MVLTSMYWGKTAQRNEPVFAESGGESTYIYVCT